MNQGGGESLVSTLGVEDSFHRDQVPGHHTMLISGRKTECQWSFLVLLLPDSQFPELVMSSAWLLEVLVSTA
jgi:hypothetical protein